MTEESNKGKRFVFRDGKFVEGKAGPRQLDEELRKLPGEWVTTEVGEAAKIHPLDPPHIREALRDDLAEAERDKPVDQTALEALVKLADAPLDVPVVPLNQWRVDAVRLRVIFSLIEQAVYAARKGKPVNLEVQHLRFLENNIHKYELRPGKPPRDKDRRSHERGLLLWVDPFNWPQRMVDALKQAGVPVPDVGAELKQYQDYRKRLRDRKMASDEAK